MRFNPIAVFIWGGLAAIAFHYHGVVGAGATFVFAGLISIFL